MKLFIHIILRIAGLFILIGVGAITGMISRNNNSTHNRRCGNGDIEAIFLFSCISYALWMIILVVESYFLHKKNAITKRDCNLYMTIAPIALMFFFIMLAQIFN